MSRAALVALCLFTLAGCTSVATAAGFVAGMKDAGYEVQGVEHDRSVLDGVLTLDLAMAGEPSDADWDKICEITWTGYPDDFSELSVTVNGTPGLNMVRRELVDAYGERP